MAKKKETKDDLQEQATKTVMPKPDPTLPGPGRDYFAVNKLNRHKDGGMVIDYTTMYPIGNTYIEETDKKTSQRVPVTEFLECLIGLKSYVARITNYADIKNLISEEKFKTTKEQSVFVTNLYNSFMKRITVNGVKIWANGQFITACEINYSLEGTNSQSMDHNTYKIDLKEDVNVHGFEDELREKLEEIVKHSYDYIFLKAGEQMEAFED